MSENKPAWDLILEHSHAKCIDADGKLSRARYMRRLELLLAHLSEEDITPREYVARYMRGRK